MPRAVAGVKPRVKDARVYYTRGREILLNPLFGLVRSRLAAVSSLEQAVASVADARTVGVQLDFIGATVDEIELYHLNRFSQTFRSAFSVDVRPLLTRPEVDMHLQRAIRENVDLIRSIPPRLHGDLVDAMRREFADAPFDQARLQRILREEFRSSGFNLRRITRDQTGKLVGNLTQIRQRQLGIDRYRWSTSADERVRDTHGLANGRIYRWDTVPALTGYHPGQDILCRCVALPVVDRLPVR